MPDRMENHVVLTAMDEVGLARRIQMGLNAEEAIAKGDASEALLELADDGKRAKQTLVAHNIRLAMSVVKHYVSPATNRSFVGDMSFEDLLQEASIGLNRAAEKFDPRLGYKFSTYAVWWIRQSVTRAIANTSTTIRLPVYIWDEWRQVDKYARDFENRNGRPPTLPELAEGVGKDPGHVRALLDWTAPIVRLDTPVDGSDGESSTLGEFLLRSNGIPVDETIANDMLLNEVRDHINKIAADYDPRFLAILDGRFGRDKSEQMTLDEIGKQFGVTRERIRQLEKKIVELLRKDPILMRLAHDYLEAANGSA
ncbi:sigma-70 family RNA polymerase sigma factor [Microbispora corallina]|nr:sigma-70 family RNA polymerase sigma factor [Microbispora corallina]